MPINGGFGGSYFGGVFGGGGPISVVRAVAVAGQVVRVVFSEEPLHISPSGRFDALNPGNYVLSVVSGSATAPIPVGVDPAAVSGPAYAVGNGTAPEAADEVGIDVAVDRQLIAGITYRITVQNVVSRLGGALGTPSAGNFPGITAVEETRIPERRQDLVDVANPPATGAWRFSGGDLAAEDPEAGLRKRVLRRLMTPKGAFRHLPLYGMAQGLKSVGSVAQCASLQADANAQIRQEPDVANAKARVSLSPLGVSEIVLAIRSRRGASVVVGQKFQDGKPVV